jgi:hypothetical protein
MKNVFLIVALAISIIGNTQNIIEVSISQIGVFAKYGKDSLHLMIAKSECGHYSRSYDPIDLKLIINKSKRKIFRFKNGLPIDTLSIKKIEFKDSIYSITVSDMCNFRYAETFGKMFDCQLVLDTRKTRKNETMPVFCYYWNCKFTINDEPMDYYAGRVTDYVKIN